MTPDSTSAIWQQGKEAHRTLSEAVAERYDQMYESANFATGSYMQFEVDTIQRLVPQAPSHAVAADLGCGTGRDTFLLAKHFGQVPTHRDQLVRRIVIGAKRRLGVRQCTESSASVTRSPGSGRGASMQTTDDGGGRCGKPRFLRFSTDLWKPVCGFHGDVISIAVFAVPDVIEADAKGDAGPLPTCRSSFLAPPTRSISDACLFDRAHKSHLGFTSGPPRCASRCGPWCASCEVRT